MSLPKVSARMLRQFEYMRTTSYSLDPNSDIYVICDEDQVITQFSGEYFIAFETIEDGNEFLMYGFSKESIYDLVSTKTRCIQQLLELLDSDIGMYYMPKKKPKVNHRICSFFKMKCGL